MLPDERFGSLKKTFVKKNVEHQHKMKECKKIFSNIKFVQKI